MHEFYPLLVIGAAISVFATVFILAYVFMKDKKEAIGFDRNMKDFEITKRLLKYAKPHRKSFLVVFFIMILSIAYDIVSPLIISRIADLIKGSFEMKQLFVMIGVYVSILIVSLVCQYFQAIILQKTGQKIISALRYDTFEHIEQLSHQQFAEIPVGNVFLKPAAYAYGFVLCAFHHNVYGHFQKIFKKSIPQGQGRNDEHKHVFIRKPVRHENNPHF